MPLDICNLTGDGINDTRIDTDVQLPDSGTSIAVAGQVQAPGLASFDLTGSPLTSPVPPGSGLIYWNIQVDTTSGAATVQQSTSADPAALPNNVIIFRQTLAPGQSDPALVPTDSTPDNPGTLP